MRIVGGRRNRNSSEKSRLLKSRKPFFKLLGIKKYKTTTIGRK
jgi:hypothetical protein